MSFSVVLVLCPGRLGGGGLGQIVADGLPPVPGCGVLSVLEMLRQPSKLRQVIELRKFAAPILHLACPYLKRQRIAVSDQAQKSTI